MKYSNHFQINKSNDFSNKISRFEYTDKSKNSALQKSHFEENKRRSDDTTPKKQICSASEN